MTMQTYESCRIGEVTYFFTDPPTVAGTPKVVETGQHLTISCCWRGYVGEWHVESGGLYLGAICGKYALPEGKPVLADWISGKLELTSIPNPGWSPSEANTNYEILVTEGVVWGFRQLPADPGRLCDRGSALVLQGALAAPVKGVSMETDPVAELSQGLRAGSVLGSKDFFTERNALELNRHDTVRHRIALYFRRKFGKGPYKVDLGVDCSKLGVDTGYDIPTIKLAARSQDSGTD